MKFSLFDIMHWPGGTNPTDFDPQRAAEVYDDAATGGFDRAFSAASRKQGASGDQSFSGAAHRGE